MPKDLAAHDHVLASFTSPGRTVTNTTTDGDDDDANDDDSEDFARVLLSILSTFSSGERMVVLPIMSEKAEEICTGRALRLWIKREKGNYRYTRCPSEYISHSYLYYQSGCFCCM